MNAFCFKGSQCYKITVSYSWYKPELCYNNQAWCFSPFCSAFEPVNPLAYWAATWCSSDRRQETICPLSEPIRVGHQGPLTCVVHPHHLLPRGHTYSLSQGQEKTGGWGLRSAQKAIRWQVVRRGSNGYMQERGQGKNIVDSERQNQKG